MRGRWPWGYGSVLSIIIITGVHSHTLKVWHYVAVCICTAFEFTVHVHDNMHTTHVCIVIVSCVSGAIALAEVLAENKHLTHLDLQENDVRVAGLMGLQLAHRMNHTLLSMDTPKAFKVEQVWIECLLSSLTSR